MEQTQNQQCPQCFYQNSLEALKCGLCDWTLADAGLDDTCISESIQTDFEPNLTIAPNIDLSTTPDPNLTIAPDMAEQALISQNQPHSDAHTFHLAGNLAHFEIHEILGQGGMGAVYHAKDRTLQRDVALKMLRPLAASSQMNTDALLDEARMASKLNHPNIVTIYDVARTKDSNFIVMEWVDGQPLVELIPGEGLELVKTLEYACQIADGIACAHQKHIIHRDIKPQNIMLSLQNTIKILDFGIADLINHQNDENNFISDPAQTNPDTGTPGYMSPEQAQRLNLDQRSDIFSFGIVLYQMLTGQKPFTGNNVSEVKQAIINGDYIPISRQLPELPSNMVSLMEKMLATNKSARWQSSAELAEALHAIYRELTGEKNWWQRRHWLSKVAIVLPFILALGWSSKTILFPPSTQQLIEQQLEEANKIAILPFDNISGDPLLQIFSDGLVTALASDLTVAGRNQGEGTTWVIPSSEIRRMKDPSVQEVSDKFSVDMIITGSVQHMGSTRSLVLNLLNARDGRQLKTTDITINANKLFQGHNRIRQEVMKLLDWTIPTSLAEKFNLQRPQFDGAYKEYIEGKGYLYRYDQAGNLDKALHAFQKAIEIDSSYENAYVSLAELQFLNFRKTKDNTWLDNMASTIEQLKQLNPNHDQINYLSAEIAMQKGEYQQAINLYQASVNQNQKHTKSQIGLARAFSKIDNTEMAENIYQTATQLAPNNWRVISGFGIFYFQNGNYQKALEQFNHLVTMSPNNDLGYRNMAAAYYSLGDIENAIVYSRLAIKLLPTGSAYTNLGTMLFYIKNYDESIIAFKMAVELDENNYLNWGNLGDAYKLTKNNTSVIAYQKAVKRAQSALKTNPKDTRAKASLAYYLANLKQEKEALFFAKQIGESNTGLENFIVATAYDHLKIMDQTLSHLKFSIKKNYPVEEILNTPLLKHCRQDQRFTYLITIK